MNAMARIGRKEISTASKSFLHSEYNKNCNLPSLQLKKSKQTSKGYLFGMGREEKSKCSQ